MTKQEQIKALAELDGIKYVAGKYGCTCNVDNDGNPHYPSCKIGQPRTRVKKYLTSHNAIIPLAVKVCKRRKLKMFCNMGLDGTWECIITANEAPNCIPCDGDFYGAGDSLCDAILEALLRATGKWKDWI